MKQMKKTSRSVKPATPAQSPAPDRTRGGRPRAFDPEPALDAAMLLFWEHGYEATSLAMLRDAMGLTPPQIYNAFTDKETLFRQALDRYHKTQVGFAIAALSAAIPTAEAIRQLLLGAATTYTAPGKPAGCLFVSGALATSPQAQAIGDLLKSWRHQTEAAIAARLAQGQAAGDLPANLKIDQLAKYIASVMNGMSIQARDGASETELIALAETALAALPIGTATGPQQKQRSRAAGRPN